MLLSGDSKELAVVALTYQMILTAFWHGSLRQQKSRIGYVEDIVTNQMFWYEAGPTMEYFESHFGA
jgi:hypothetical protein